MGRVGSKKRYSDDFRRMMVDLHQAGHSVKDLSTQYDVSEVSIYRWVQKLNATEIPKSNSVDLSTNKHLQQQILSLREENRILKKALGIILSSD